MGENGTDRYRSGSWSCSRNRINIEADVYYRKTTDMLLDAPLPNLLGLWRRSYRNVGSMENKGIELSLNTVNVQTADFDMVHHLQYVR